MKQQNTRTGWLKINGLMHNPNFYLYKVWNVGEILQLIYDPWGVLKTQTSKTTSLDPENSEPENSEPENSDPLVS